MKKKLYILYIIIFLVISLIPSVGLIFGGSEESSENRTLAEAPVLKDENGWNTEFLSDAGTYFEDHFAFRNEWVTGYSLLAGKIFGVSAQDSVIVGKNNWLYYTDSLEDYQGSGLLTDRQLFDIAHTLSMVQTYAEENGIDFAFAIAPNKNSLYGENMPYYYQYYRDEEKNLTRIQSYLESEGVNYVDLYSVLSSEDEVLYHARDSHWNNKGASIAADTILSALDHDHVSYTDESYTVVRDYEGDLDTMLYPSAVTLDDEIYYDRGQSYSYVEEVESNFDTKINTVSDSGTGRLVMYRDSFGNALLPFIAEAFEEAYFSRGVPYQLTDLFTWEADTLIIERAERFLPDMAENAPTMPAPIVLADTLGDVEYDSDIENLAVEDLGTYTKVTGTVPADKLETESLIYVRVNGLINYEAFPVTTEDGQEGFQVLLLTELLEEDNQFELYIK